MKLLQKLLLFGALVGVAGLIASFPIANSYSNKAKLVQRIEVSEGDSLFGEAGTPIGSAQMLIIDDPKAFTGEVSPEGAAYVSEKYLQENQIYPLQLQTVNYIATNARIGFSVGAVVALLLSVWVGKRRARATGVAQAV